MEYRRLRRSCNGHDGRLGDGRNQSRPFENQRQSLTRSMMPSTETGSPSLFHHLASHTWQEQNMTSVPSGSFISISMTELCPHDTQTKPVSGAFSTCPPLLTSQPYDGWQYASSGTIFRGLFAPSPASGRIRRRQGSIWRIGIAALWHVDVSSEVLRALLAILDPVGVDIWAVGTCGA